MSTNEGKQWHHDYTLQKEMERDESREELPYVDTVGKITIGIGHNLSDNGLPDDLIDLLYRHDIKVVVTDLDKHLPWWRKLDETRQRVIINMCFNLGIERLLKFHRTLQAMEQGRYEEAAQFMLQSKWAKQVKLRAKRLSKIMEGK